MVFNYIYFGSILSFRSFDLCYVASFIQFKVGDMEVHEMIAMVEAGEMIMVGVVAGMTSEEMTGEIYYCKTLFFFKVLKP